MSNQCGSDPREQGTLYLVLFPGTIMIPLGETQGMVPIVVTTHGGTTREVYHDFTKSMVGV